MELHFNERLRDLNETQGPDMLRHCIIVYNCAASGLPCVRGGSNCARLEWADNPIRQDCRFKSSTLDGDGPVLPASSG